jgi:pimeloyl-ACP methyl ester carboxylesterase
MTRFGTALAASLVLLTACGSSPGSAAPSTTVASPSAGPVCFGDPGDARPATIDGTGGKPLRGYVVGSGAVGVVLANQAAATACGWLPYAKMLAGRGYRVLAFDFNGEGNSTESGAPGGADVASAARFLRAQAGIRDVVLLGASRGGTAVLVAAGALQPPPRAVVALSAPAQYNEDDAAASIAALTVPVLLVAAQGDESFAADARAMHAKMRPATSTLVIVPGSGHGVDFVLTVVDGGEQAMKAVDDYLRTRAPAQP